MDRRLGLLLLSFAAFGLGAAASVAAAQTAQAWSVPLRVHRSLPATDAVRAAERALAAAPDDRSRVIELARAQAGVRQMREAIVTLSSGIARWPDAAELYRWRGHRYLSVREFDRALADFDRGLALDSAVYGIWYHLGVVRFVRGEFDAAARAFIRARPLAPDSAEAAGSADWLWMSLVRGGRFAQAATLLRDLPAFAGVQNAYTRRLQLYRGELQPEEIFTPADTADTQIATLAFGVGNYLLALGDTTGAETWFRRSAESTGWPAFGFIAAEADVARLRATWRVAAIGSTYPNPPEFDPLGAARLTCLANVPEDRSQRVLARVTLHTDGPPLPRDEGPLRDLAVTMHEAAEQFRSESAAIPGELPEGEPRFDWLDLTGVLDVIVRRGGSIQTRVVRVDPEHPARSGAVLRAFEGPFAERLRAAEWPRRITADSLRFRLAISVPMVVLGASIDTVGAYASAPLLSVRVASAKGTWPEQMNYLEYPYQAWREELEAALIVSFTLDTLGRVFSESVTDNWPEGRARPRGAEGEAYFAFWREARRVVQLSRWTPSELGGCRGPHRVDQPFGFYLRRP